jgi:hypothetical protein
MIFDVIKCHIDSRFLLADLERIPSPILEKWCYEDLGILIKPANAQSIYNYMTLNADKKWYGWSEHRDIVLAALKKRLKEYDDI